MTDLYGPIIAQMQLERAVLDLLQGVPADGEAPLIVYYLAEVERQAGLRPQILDKPATFRGGTDLNRWQTDQSPLVIAVAKAQGSPERIDTTQYKQLFQVQVATILKMESEDYARRYASLYGAAVMKLIADHGAIGPNPYDSTVKLGTHTEITGYPIPEFAVDDTTSRNIMRAVVTFTTLVSPILSQGGPLTFTGSPYEPAGNWPDVATVDVTVTAQPLTT